MTQSFYKSIQEIKAEWLMSLAISTVEIVECLSLQSAASASPSKSITVPLAFRSSVRVGRRESLASLATAADTIVWLAPVSGMQLTSKPREHYLGGPSHSGISGVGRRDDVD